MKRLFRYRDRDDQVEVETVAVPHDRHIWVARVPGSDVCRAICPFPGFATADEAEADAVSLLNAVGED